MLTHPFFVHARFALQRTKTAGVAIIHINLSKLQFQNLHARWTYRDSQNHTAEI